MAGRGGAKVRRIPCLAQPSRTPARTSSTRLDVEPCRVRLSLWVGMWVGCGRLAGWPVGGLAWWLVGFVAVMPSCNPVARPALSLRQLPLLLLLLRLVQLLAVRLLLGLS